MKSLPQTIDDASLKFVQNNMLLPMTLHAKNVKLVIMLTILRESVSYESVEEIKYEQLKATAKTANPTSYQIRTDKVAQLIHALIIVK